MQLIFLFQKTKNYLLSIEGLLLPILGLTADTSFFAEGGFEGKRQVTILNEARELYNKDIKSAPFIGAGLKIGFGKSPDKDSHEIVEDL
ncbi:MAG: hypothetical protein H7281_04095 [Bacteriovorax sp.]|nr:hypothetical protein [Bacteriovorax sp.]